MKGHGDLRLTTAAALICAVAAVAVPLEAVRLAFAAPLTLFLPGYAIAAACFAQRRLPGAQVWVLSLGLSLCSLALGAFVLNYAPGGIRTISWALLLVLVVLAGCLAAAARRGQAAGERRVRLPRPRPLAVALTGAGLLAAVAALVLAATTFTVESAVGHTQLWVLPEPDSGSNEFKVGVGNQEQTAVPFDLLIRIGDEPLIRRAFTLDPGETEILRLDAGPTPAGTQIPVVATLLRQNRTDEIALRVQNWVPAPEGAG
jgi:hypothetical protein